MNAVFVNAGAAYYHKNHILEYLTQYSLQQNCLLDAITKWKHVVIQASCRALGIIGKLLTGSLFCSLSVGSHIFSLFVAPPPEAQYKR